MRHTGRKKGREKGLCVEERITIFYTGVGLSDVESCGTEECWGGDDIDKVKVKVEKCLDENLFPFA